MWYVRELPGEIEGVIPVGASYSSRGEEIDVYLKAHPTNNYVIIDDFDDFTEQQQWRYIKTNPIAGITEKDAQKAIRILTMYCSDNAI